MSDKQRNLVRQAVAVVIVLAGVACIGLGAAWQTLVPPRSFWSPAQAQEYDDASVALKSVATRPDRRASDKVDPELDAARARFDRIQADLERAISRRNSSGILVVIGGVVLVVSGIALLIRVRTPSANR